MPSFVSKLAAPTIALATLTFALPAWSAEQVVTFEDGTVNAAPDGMVCKRAGRGKSGKWRIVNDKGNKTLAQLGKDRTNSRFPVCVVKGVSAKDVTLSVRFKPISGGVDQAAGLVWRYQGKNDFYVVRANALEDNVVLYKMYRGRRSDLPLVGKGRTYGAGAEVPRGKWSELTVDVQGDVFTVFLNGKELYKVQDKTFTKAGGVGVWTKADSVTYFDDLKIVTK